MPFDTWEFAQPAVVPAALVVGSGVQTGACAQGLTDAAVRLATQCRIVVAHSVTDTAAAWMPVVAVSAACAAWGT
eukprot:3484760-Alexandrium_andersonii.AAC.1